MQLSTSFTSINGSTKGTIQWSDIDTASSSLTVAGTEIPLTESSGTASFELEGLVLIDFESGDAASFQVDPPPAEGPATGWNWPGLPGYDLDFFF